MKINVILYFSIVMCFISCKSENNEILALRRECSILKAQLDSMEEIKLKSLSPIVINSLYKPYYNLEDTIALDITMYWNRDKDYDSTSFKLFEHLDSNQYKEVPINKWLLKKELYYGVTTYQLHNLSKGNYLFGGTVNTFKGKSELIFYEFKVGNVNTFPDSWKENIFDVIKGKSRVPY